MEKARLYSSWQETVHYGGEGPSHTLLIKTDNYNAVMVGLDAGQKIPPHVAPDAMYHFLEGRGTMIVDDERIPVQPGATVSVHAGAARGIEADARIALLASHAVPAATARAPMPARRMLIMGSVGVVIMVGLMAGLALMLGSASPMTALMFSSSGPIGMGLWAMMIVPVVVMAAMMGGMFLFFRRTNSAGHAAMAGHHGGHMHTTAQKASTMTFSIPSITCDHCKMTIENGLGGLPGVSSVTVDVEKKSADVTFAPPATESAIEARLAEMGYAVSA